MPQLRRVGGVCPCSKSVRWVADEASSCRSPARSAAAEPLRRRHPTATDRSRSDAMSVFVSAGSSAGSAARAEADRRHGWRARYVAGETLDDALDTVRSARRRGRDGDPRRARRGGHRARRAPIAAVEEYVRMLRRDRRPAGCDSNVSIKPTVLGLKIDEALLPRERRAHRGRGARARQLRAHRHGGRLDHRRHAAHLPRAARRATATSASVLQAYMRRTLRRHRASCRRRAPTSGSARGSTSSRATVAWKGYETVRAQLPAGAREAARARRLRRHRHPRRAPGRAARWRCSTGHRVPRERYEFQMLLGVEPELRRILIAGRATGCASTCPYGRDWYPYSMRRLRENPEIARHVLRSLIPGRRPAAEGALRPGTGRA